MAAVCERCGAPTRARRCRAEPGAWPCVRRAAQRGASLVELMVGVAVGLVVVAAAVTLAATQVAEHRRLQLEAQVQQDLRAAADLVTRELRRAGHWPDATLAIATADAPAAPNPHAAIAPDATPTTQVDFAYARPDAASGPFGFRLDGRVLRMRFGAAGWQELTDANVLRVTSFTVTPRHGAPIRLPCPKLCADGTAGCWPTLTVREFVIDIAGEAAADPAVRRTLRTVVRPRNDLVVFDAAATSACPS